MDFKGKIKVNGQDNVAFPCNSTLIFAKIYNTVYINLLNLLNKYLLEM